MRVSVKELKLMASGHSRPLAAPLSASQMPFAWASQDAGAASSAASGGAQEACTAGATPRRKALSALPMVLKDYSFLKLKLKDLKQKKDCLRLLTCVT